MADRSIKVRLEAQVDGYRAAMRQAQDSTDRFASHVDKDGKRIDTAAGRMVRSAEVNREAWNTAGTTLTAFGAVGVAALGLSAKAAIDWESDWAGVLKTVEGTPAQLDELEGSLRDMALRLPASASEIAGVAEAAGQLGVKVEDVAEFTETMVNLGETTNMSAQEAATALARMANIMGTAVSDVDRMGATIVDLGNNAATTEREIVELSTRLAAAGSQAGLSEADVLAFASSLTSVGVPAEAAGTAMSKVFTAINDATIDGGEKLEKFAEVAGVSTSEFRRAFEEDAASAIGMFVEGMGQMATSGESTTAVFDELELTDQRLARSVLSLGSATGLLGEQLDIANGAWEDNTALIEEAEKRYDTTEAKIQIAKNSLNEAAIAIGENMLPMLAGLADGVATATQWFADLPGPIQGAIGGLTGVVSVGALATGGFLLLFPRIMDTHRAFKDLAAISPRAASGLKRFAKGGGAVAAALIGIAAIGRATEGYTSKATGMTLSVAETTKALLEMEEAGTSLEGAFSFSDDVFGATGNVESLADAAARITAPSNIDRLNDLSGSIRGVFGMDEGTSRTKSIEQIETIGDALGSLVQSGEAERAAKQFEMLAAEWEAGGGDIEELKRLMPGYTDALADAENQAELTTDATFDLAEETKTYSEALEENIALMRDATGATMDEWDALTQYADAVDAATEALYDENDELIKGAATLDAHSEAGRANRDALSNLADSTWDWVEAGVGAGATTEDLTDRMQEGRDAFIEAAQEMGATREEAEDLADSMGLIPGDIPIEVGVTGMAAAERNLRTLRTLALNVPGATSINAGDVLRARGYDVAMATGGPVWGAGSATSDSIPAMLSNGEFVHRTAAHEFWGTPTMNAINNNDVAGVLNALSVKGFAGGGSVAPAIPAPNVSVNASVGDLVARMDSRDIAALAGAITSAAATGTSRAFDAESSATQLETRMG
ncbi:phage tail tape measure protein [Demequina sp. SO4-18]|uniref:phage tail tape measure protein n=1 Tax=Demequina sp. SO4-18 TaxID=3401026 RepID=UPI003B5CC2A9